jgi:hypothetical protein
MDMKGFDRDQTRFKVVECVQGNIELFDEDRVIVDEFDLHSQPLIRLSDARNFEPSWKVRSR